MKNLKFLILLVFGAISVSKAQDTVLQYKSIFKINPFSLVDWHNQSFTLAYERVINSKSVLPFTWQLEAGPILSNYTFPNENYRGYKTRFEIRFYNRSTHIRQFFFGLNTGYNQVWYKTTMSYSPTGNGSSWSGIHRLKEVSFMKKINTVNFLIGYIKPVNKKLYVEFYGGVGTRKTNLKSQTKDYNMVGWQPDNQFDMSGYYTEAGKFNYPNFTGGIKFGFKIN